MINAATEHQSDRQTELWQHIQTTQLIIRECWHTACFSVF